jgi:hypothetical protein
MIEGGIESRSVNSGLSTGDDVTVKRRRFFWVGELLEKQFGYVGQVEHDIVQLF